MGVRLSNCYQKRKDSEIALDFEGIEKKIQLKSANLMYYLINLN